ncbi:MAG: glycosyltransferase family 4 protein [Myxococcales bacterium]|nr:glycosyltransferase family 4 protein [Myxococcales bacterium]
MLTGLRVAFAALEAFPNAKGSGTRITEMVRGLAEAGAEVTLLSLPGRRDAPLPHPRVTLHPLRIAEGNYLARALAFQAEVARALARLRPDVVHVRGPFEGQAWRAAPGARRVFEVNGLPSVELRYHYGGFTESPALEGKLRGLEASVLGEADMVLTQSETTRAFLGYRGLRPEVRCHVIHNGASLSERPSPSAHRADRPELAPVAEHADGAPLVERAERVPLVERAERVPLVERADRAPLGDVPTALYIGSFAPWQGLAELLMATRRLLRAGVPMRLQLIGPSKKRWRAQLARAARRLKIADTLVLDEPLARPALADVVARADVCVAPLRRDLRNAVQGCNPIKLYEYMAAGRAVLATDLACVREIVDDGRTGILARPSSPRALAEGLGALLEDPTLRARLGDAAQEEVARRGTWAHRRAELVAAYEALLRARA